MSDMSDANENLDLIDHNTEVSIVVNAIYFDLGILIAETLDRFPNYDSLPIDEIIDNLIMDKRISNDEARRILNDFTKKYYSQETYHGIEKTT